ncbi:esterase/lipase family protein [Persephonella sp.]
MKEITLILHGWSDCSDSFKDLKAFLIKNGIGSVDTIYYADYESREDNVTFEDIIDGLYDRFKEKGFIDKHGNKTADLNVIVHSTGGLVIRHFIAEYYRHRLDRCPVKKIVMLAPANFGSPLAHYGKSLLGRVFKGRYKFGDLFEVGRKLLNGLELASPYQWKLAHLDLLVESPYFNRNQIQTFIFVGNKGYSGLRKLANKKGTDGTVVVCGANLNPVKFIFDFSKEGKALDIYVKDYKFDTAFAVLRNYDHGSIVEDIKPDKKSQIGKLVLKALRIKSADEYVAFKKDLEKITENSFKNREIYQQFIVRAVDDHNKPIKDYTIEFFVYRYNNRYIKNGEFIRKKISEEEELWSKKIHELITDEFHNNSTDPSFRRFLVGIKRLKGEIEECCKSLGSDIVLSMKIYVPRVDEGIYYETEKLKNIILLKTKDGKIVNEKPSIFYPNTTTFIEMKINRSTKYVTVDIKPKKH